MPFCMDDADVARPGLYVEQFSTAACQGDPVFQPHRQQASIAYSHAPAEYPAINKGVSILVNSPPPLSDPHDNNTEPAARKDTLIEFPSAFPLKVMGLQVPEFLPAVLEMTRAADPDFDTASIELRPSSAGKYLGVTVTITATSQLQLDNLYRALTSHPLVKVVL